jgi:hypothetical protein
MLGKNKCKAEISKLDLSMCGFISQISPTFPQLEIKEQTKNPARLLSDNAKNVSMNLMSFVCLAKKVNKTCQTLRN